MAATPMPSSREIARAAVRVRLASIALDHFTARGFDDVTVTEVAREAGVSRSTFLRYFETKEDAVLCAVDPAGAAATAHLLDRPAEEDDWTALRRCLDGFVSDYTRDPGHVLAGLRLVHSVPGINARRLQRQRTLAADLAQALDRRHGAGGPTVRSVTRANAALACMTVAIDRWADSGGSVALAALVDDAFAALAGLRPPT